MNNKLMGTGFGMIAGSIDVLPMIMQKLTWDANLSAFAMWTVVGFILSSIDFKMNSIGKGVLISCMILLPTAILIAWKEPVTLIPVSVMTIIIGGSLGFFIDRFKIKG